MIEQRSIINITIKITRSQSVWLRDKEGIFHNGSTCSSSRYAKKELFTIIIFFFKTTLVPKETIRSTLQKSGLIGDFNYFFFFAMVHASYTFVRFVSCEIPFGPAYRTIQINYTVYTIAADDSNFFNAALRFIILFFLFVSFLTT